VFSHEKLTVYQKALLCVAILNQEARSWAKRHAVVDHLLRASESILLNLVEGARLRGATGAIPRQTDTNLLTRPKRQAPNQRLMWTYVGGAASSIRIREVKGSKCSRASCGS
jgi:hypothetical protein